MLLYITYGVIEPAESMKMTTLLERLSFTSYVMMSDLKLQACRKWMIIMPTELGVRGGPSLSLSLMMVICIGVGMTLLGPWVPSPGLWAVLGLFFPVPGLWACFCLVLFAFPGLWGFAWLFCWLCPFVGLGFVFQV